MQSENMKVLVPHQICWLQQEFHKISQYESYDESSW
jgi:hypothetical protein